MFSVSFKATHHLKHTTLSHAKPLSLLQLSLYIAHGGICHLGRQFKCDTRNVAVDGIITLWSSGNFSSTPLFCWNNSDQILERKKIKSSIPNTFCSQIEEVWLWLINYMSRNNAVENEAVFSCYSRLCSSSESSWNSVFKFLSGNYKQ